MRRTASIGIFFQKKKLKKKPSGFSKTRSFFYDFSMIRNRALQQVIHRFASNRERTGIPKIFSQDPGTPELKTRFSGTRGRPKINLNLNKTKTNKIANNNTPPYRFRLNSRYCSMCLLNKLQTTWFCTRVMF